MQYRQTEDASMTYISLTSLEEPDSFPPREHIYWADPHPWLHLADDVPQREQITN
jgi:hypothetical protein